VPDPFHTQVGETGFAAQVIGTGPTVRYSAMPEMFESLIYSARRELVISTPYYVPDNFSTVSDVKVVSALMEAAEKEIRQAKGRLAIIETSSTPAYENTVRFHLGQGYELIARIPDFYSPGDDKLILQKLTLCYHIWT